MQNIFRSSSNKQGRKCSWLQYWIRPLNSLFSLFVNVSEITFRKKKSEFHRIGFSLSRPILFLLSRFQLSKHCCWISGIYFLTAFKVHTTQSAECALWKVGSIGFCVFTEIRIYPWSSSDDQILPLLSGLRNWQFLSTLGFTPNL